MSEMCQNCGWKIRASTCLWSDGLLFTNLNKYLVHKSKKKVKPHMHISGRNLYWKGLGTNCERHTCTSLLAWLKRTIKSITFAYKHQIWHTDSQITTQVSIVMLLSKIALFELS